METSDGGYRPVTESELRVLEEAATGDEPTPSSVGGIRRVLGGELQLSFLK